jgi:UDP-N-acetylmuramoyl-L-alanyl-D-glutamate--2,6-diaminopimelate ligase
MMAVSPATNNKVQLRDLFAGLTTAPAELPNIAVSDITTDSSRVGEGSLFLACQGLQHHGLEFVADAVVADATAIAWEPAQGVSAPAVPESVATFSVADLDQHVGVVADRFFGEPSEHISVIGITGTNGKTTTAWLASEALSQLAGKSAYMGTLGYGVVPDLVSSALTTPGCIAVHRRLHELQQAGVKNTVMEVSSHGLDQGRIDGVRVQTAAFTNLSRDHLDYHGDFAAYKAAKAKLFSAATLQTAVINTGDEFGAELARSLGDRVKVISVALAERVQPDAEPALSAVYSESVEQGLRIQFSGAFGAAEMNSALWGRFNVENLLVATGILLAHGYSLEQAVVALQNGSVPPGRMQVLKRAEDQPAVIVDFAHTPDALANVLETIRHYCAGKIVCVFGCGGERDQGKRGEMGAVASQLADSIIVTNDNPRNEDPQAIIDAIIAGIETDINYEVLPDRAAAIRQAITNAEATDVILIAGKGSENYQLIAGKAELFSDEETAAAVLGENS